MAINKIKELIEDSGIIFVAYVGSMTQKLLFEMIEELKEEKEMKEISSIRSHNIITVLIEMTQNIMKYTEIEEDDKSKSNGLILVGKHSKNDFFVHSQNKVTVKDAKRIAYRIDEIKASGESEIKLKYKELRKNASQSHKRGAGIGFYEIAKRTKTMNYEFEEINADKSYFYLTINIK